MHRGDNLTVVIFVETSEYFHSCTLPSPEIRPNELKADCHFIFLSPSQLKQMLRWRLKYGLQIEWRT